MSELTSNSFIQIKELNHILSDGRVSINFTNALILTPDPGMIEDPIQIEEFTDINVTKLEEFTSFETQKFFISDN